MYRGGGLTEKNYQRCVICVLRIRETTSFLEKEAVFVPDRGGGVDENRHRSQLIGLNLLILVTA